MRYDSDSSVFGAATSADKSRSVTHSARMRIHVQFTDDCQLTDGDRLKVTVTSTGIQYLDTHTAGGLRGEGSER